MPLCGLGWRRYRLLMSLGLNEPKESLLEKLIVIEAKCAWLDPQQPLER
jgi:hypothetical protein